MKYPLFQAEVSSVAESIQATLEADSTTSSDLSNTECRSDFEDAGTDEEFVEDIETVDSSELISTQAHDQELSKEPLARDGEIKPGHQLLKEFYLKLIYIQYLTNMSSKVFTVIVQLVFALLSVIAEIFCVNELRDLLKDCSASIYKMKKALGLNKDNFEIFVVCPLCNTLYNEKQAVKKTASGHLQSRRCSNKPFPMHTQRTKRAICGAVLMKRVKTKSNKEYLAPKKSYPYASVINCLKDFLSRPGFLEKCNKWKKREIVPGRFEDIYDGKVWKELQKVDGKPFLENGRTFGFMLNVDWFQPYKHVGHSVGVVYLSIMNLPREDRFKEENIMVVGLIPGPNEPAGNINTFLKPLVDELKQLEKGVSIFENMYKAALLCVAADLPAVRKTCGFLSFSAKQGCSKCFKTFKSGAFSEKMDYSGYEQNTLRNGFIHKQRANVTLRQVTPLAKKQKEVLLSARYSVLNELDHFDPVRFHVIDPMHNLLLGTAKHMLKVWKESELLTNESLDAIQDLLNDVVVPCDIGRIPNQIATMFSSLTADQWKHWTCVYSLFALKDKLDVRHYNCWSSFVAVCRLLCRRSVTQQDLDDAERCLYVFLRSFEKLYDKNKFCTPNMHMHVHLRKCIEDYGSVYNFWCFSFERMNGILGEFNLNNHKINVTLMRHFQQKFKLKNLVNVCENYIKVDVLSVTDTRGTVAASEKNMIRLTQPLKLKYLLPEFKVKCESLIKSVNSSIIRVKHHYYSAKSIVLKHRYITTSDTSVKNSVVYVQLNENETRPCVVREIMQVFYLIKEDGQLVEKEMIVVRVDLHRKHPNRYFFGQNSPVHVFGVDFEHESQIVGIDKISCRAGWLQHAIKISKHFFERVTVAIPLLD